MKKFLIALLLALSVPAGAVNYFQWSTEVAPGAGTKMTAYPQADGSFLQAVACSVDPIVPFVVQQGNPPWLFALPTNASQENGGHLENLDDKFDVNLSTRASEATLAAFASDNHSDLFQLNTDLVAFATANHLDLLAIQTRLDTANGHLSNLDTRFDVNLSTRSSEATLSLFGSTNHADLALIDADLNLFKVANHSDLTLIDTDVLAFKLSNHVDLTLLDTDLNLFKTANHTDLLGVQTRIDSTNTKLDTANSNLTTIQGKQDTGNISLASIDAKVSTSANQNTLNTRVGDLTETAPATDTASSGLNGRLQRIAQNITTTNGKIDTVNSNLVTIQGKQDAQTTQLTAINANTDDLENRLGATNETTAGTDSATSGLNGLTKRVNLHLTNLEGFTDGIEGLLTTGNTNTSTIATSLTSGNQKSQIVDATGAVVGPMQTMNAVNYMPVATQPDTIMSVVNVTTVDVGTVTTTGFGGQQFIIGTPTANSAASFALSSIQTVMIEIKGIWTGTLQVEVSSDSGTTWVPRGMHVVGTSIFAASVTAPVLGSINASAKTNVRVRATAAMTGTAQVSILYSDNPSNVYVANALVVKDGSSTTSTNQLAIKAASTAPLATDTAAVVGLSPNGNQATAALQTAGNASVASIDTDVDVALSTRASAANQTNGTQKTQVVDGSGNVQPSGDAVGRAIFMKNTDGTNVAAVKAASTSPAATDPSLVVSVGPNRANLTPTHASVSVGNTSTATVAANANRAGLSIQNVSANMEACAFGVAAVLNTGIVLYPGGRFDMDEFSFSTAAVNCIGAAGSTTTATVDWTR